MMEEEDDDVLFDQAGLLSNRIKPMREIQGRKVRIYCTVCLCAAFFGLGLCIAIPGPTLLDLQQQTNSDTSQISRIFTGRSVGYLVGSIIGGFLFDQLNQSCLLSFSLLLSALGTAAAPWCTSYLFLMGILAFQGVSMGFLDTGGNVLCLNTWGRQSAPYMQTLHFSFGVGAFVAPLIAEPFLSNATFNETLIEMEQIREQEAAEAAAAAADVKLATGATQRRKLLQLLDVINGQSLHNGRHDNVRGRNKRAKGVNNLNPRIRREDETKTTTPMVKIDSTVVKENKTIIPVGKETNETSTVPAVVSNETKVGPDKNNKIAEIKEKITNLTTTVTDAINNLSKVEFAYLTIALFNFVVCIMFLALCCCGGRTLKAIRNQDIQPEYLVRKENRGFRVQILIMLFFFYFLYVGMEVSYGAFLMAFCVDYLHWTKTKGTLITSVFWGSFAMGRGLAIPLAKCLNPPIMLIADLILCCISLMGLIMGLESNDTILWFCTAVLGLGLSSIFPTGITWAERYMHVTGKATAVFVVGSALGEMAMPAVVGFLFESKNPMWLIKILLASSLLSVVLYIFMQNLASNMGDRYQRLPRISLHQETDIEMEPVPITNHTEVFNCEDSPPPLPRSESAKRVTFNLSNSHSGMSMKKGSILKSKGNAKQD